MASFFSSGFFGFGKKRSSNKKFARDLDDDTDKEKSYPRAKSTGLLKGQLFPRPKLSFSWVEICLIPVAPGPIAANAAWRRCAQQEPLVTAAVPVFLPFAQEASQAFAPQPKMRFFLVSQFSRFFGPCSFLSFCVQFVEFTDHRLAEPLLAPPFPASSMRMNPAKMMMDESPFAGATPAATGSWIACHDIDGNPYW